MKCLECVQHTARTVARISPGLNGQMARQLFTALFPEQACLPMATAFVQIISRDGAAPAKPPRSEPSFAQPAFERPMYRTAVA